MLYATYGISDSCYRPVIGNINFQVIGWGAQGRSAVFLIPLTIVSILMLPIGMHRRRKQMMEDQVYWSSLVVTPYLPHEIHQ